MLLQPGHLSRLKSIALHELHVAVALAGGDLERARDLLRDSLHHLQLEPKDSPEGRLHALALQELLTVEDSLRQDALQYQLDSQLQTVSRAQPLPVMVYVHGDGFLTGSGWKYGPEFLLDRDVVLVSFNYRLGALGFLSTGDDVIPGNFGMKDQVQLLRWVRDNIAAFGGDPDQVTIFGESAGGASVHALTLSPLAK
ncbi:Venom carboxylesterase-6, partial [Frankliniella fusca]